jgi:hypothetical protein
MKALGIFVSVLLLGFAQAMAAEPSKGVVDSVDLVNQQVVIDGTAYQMLPSTRRGDVVRWPDGEVNTNIIELDEGAEVFFEVKKNGSGSKPALQYLYRVIK